MHPLSVPALLRRFSFLFCGTIFPPPMSPASPERAVFHDLNPKGDGHWYYKTVLDFHAKKQKKNPDYGFNYGHFTIADNLSVSDDNLRKTLST